MIEAVFHTDPQGRCDKVTISGHAMAAGDGEFDLVCAAVSVLSITLINGMETYSRDTVHSMENGDGYLEADICFADDAIPDPSTELLLHVLQDGLASIADQFPCHLRIQYRQHS